MRIYILTQESYDGIERWLGVDTVPDKLREFQKDLIERSTVETAKREALDKQHSGRYMEDDPVKKLRAQEAYDAEFDKIDFDLCWDHAFVVRWIDGDANGVDCGYHEEGKDKP